MQAVDNVTTEAVEKNDSFAVDRTSFSRNGTRFKIASRRRPMDTSEYAQAHGTLYRLGPKTSKRARKQTRQTA